MTGKIRAALESHLSAMTPALSTAWENVKFTPVNGTPYQQVNLLNATPDNRIVGCDRRIELGIFQIMLCYPIDKGAGPAETRAALIIDHFKRGTRLQNSGQWLLITKTPAKRVLGADGAVFKIVISINWQADVFG